MASRKKTTRRKKVLKAYRRIRDVRSQSCTGERSEASELRSFVNHSGSMTEGLVDAAVVVVKCSNGDITRPEVHQAVGHT